MKSTTVIIKQFGRQYGSTLVALVAAAASGLVLVACGGGGDDQTAAVAGTVAAPSTTTSAAVASASSCSALRSGNYRVLDAHLPTQALSRVSLDAASLTLSASGSTTTRSLVPVSGSNCAFTADGGKTSARVSSAGVVLLIGPDASGKLRSTLMLPEQSVPLSALAGGWTWVTFNAANAGGTQVGGLETATLDTAAARSSGLSCKSMAAKDCSALGTGKAYVLNADGGYDAQNADGTLAARIFPVKAASGSLGLVALYFDAQGRSRGLGFAAPTAALALPSAGAMAVELRGTWLDSQGLAHEEDGLSFVAKSVDAAAGSYAYEITDEGFTHVETRFVNKPFNGLWLRQGGNYTVPGSTIHYPHQLWMPMPGLGLSLSINDVSGGSNSSGNIFYGWDNELIIAIDKS